MATRIRLTYRSVASEGPPAGNLGRRWSEAFEAAGLSLARPEGSRKARIELGPPLPAGVAGEAELVDAWLAEPVVVDEVCARLASVAPPGVAPVRAAELGERLPSLSMLLRAARYRCCWAAGVVDPSWLREQVAAFTARAALDWEERRGERIRRFDLRAMVRELEVHDRDASVCLDARVVLTHDRTMRPASLLAALEIDTAPESIVRTAIEVEHPQVALRAWRERGRFS